MKTIHIKTIVLGAAFALTAVGTSQAEPSPDLMNSIYRLRLDAQKNSKAAIATARPASASVTYLSWSRTRTITAGQSSVAVPDLSHREVGKGTPSDFKVAPLQQPNSTPERK